MAQTKPNLKIRALLKGVEFNSLSNAYKFEYMVLFIVPVLSLNRCKNVPKNVIKNRDPRCTSVTQETPILKIWA